MKNEQSVIEQDEEQELTPRRTEKPQTFARDNAEGGGKSQPATDHPQDSQPVSGEAAMNLPPESELVQRSKIQG